MAVVSLVTRGQNALYTPHVLSIATHVGGVDQKGVGLYHASRLVQKQKQATHASAEYTEYTGRARPARWTGSFPHTGAARRRRRRAPSVP